jgi:general L-amino acid transport system permease protein
VILPVLAILWALGFHLGYPELKGFNFKGGIYMRNSLIALWIALSLYTAAFIAENVRAGIQAVAKGQSEAAYALGISPGRTMNLIILPQALRIIIPPVISQYLNLTKNSSLAIAVGYMDLTGTLMGITLNQTGRELETVLMGMAIYLIISLAISTVMNWYNNSVKLVER